MWATDRRWARHAALWAALTAASTAATAAPSVAAREADAARGGHPVVTQQDLQRARDRHRMPSEEEIRRIPIPATPRIDRLPVPATREPLDLEAIARGFNADAPPTGRLPASGPSVLVFISFAMPEATLTRLAEQASRARATLVLRGLVDGSMAKTVTRVQRLIADRKVAVQIDPQAFDRYSIVRTPSFVLAREALAQPCAGERCAPAGAFALVSGDVSLDYALTHVQRSAPSFSTDAAAFLRRLGR